MIVSRSRTAAISGASGYLGGVIRRRLQADGWTTIDLVRTPQSEHSRPFRMGTPLHSDLLDGVNILVHCAYDMTLHQRSGIWRVNVEGTRQLLRLARESGVERVIVLSSMSAFDGTEQHYGQAKLQIEGYAQAIDAISIRPGLVYGPTAGGMAGTLARFSRLPVIPLIGSHSYQFTVHEDDFADAVAAIVTAERVSTEPIGIANPVPVPFRQILEHFAREQGRRCRFVPIDWRLVNNGLKFAERLRVPLPIRADSLLGLIKPAPFVPNLAILDSLGIRLRRFGQPIPPKASVVLDPYSGFIGT